MISPGQARLAREAASSPDVHKTIEQIDSMLCSAPPGSDFWTRSTRCTPVLSEPAIEYVMQQYRSVGWIVTRIADSRDGDYIEFRETQPRMRK